jgi:hypothetical protein
MKTSKSILISVALLSFCFSAAAVELVSLPKAPQKRLPIEQNLPPLECSQVLDALMKYSDLAREHNNVIAGFLGEVVGRVKDWHSVLQPLEGKNQSIARGTFDTLLAGADEIDKVTNLAYDNGAILGGELDRIINSLSVCQINQ